MFYRQQKKWKFTRDPEKEPDSEPMNESETDLNLDQEALKQSDNVLSCSPKYSPNSDDSPEDQWEYPVKDITRVWSLQSINGFMTGAALAPHSSENDLTTEKSS